METYISTDCPENSCETLLAGLLSFIHEGSFLSHWYRLWDHADDNPTREVRRLSKEEYTNKIDQLNQSSLPRYVGIDHDKWIYLLKRCGLVSVSTDGKVSMTNVEKWNSFFITYDIVAEVEPAKCLRTNTRWYIRLGKKGPNWIDKAATQAKKGRLVPPRCPNIEYIGRRLNAELHDMIIDEEEDGWGDACGRDTGDIAINNNNNSNSNSNECQSQRGSDELQAETGPATTPTKYPLLESLQLKDIRLADIDLSDDAQNDKFKRILGEMVAKQQQYTNNKNRIEYFQLRQNTTTTAVAIRSHATEAAFQNFHGINPYLHDVVECLDNDVKVGASRLTEYLAKHHSEAFIDAANESKGVAVCGVLDAEQSAALYTEADLTDQQWNTIMRHLRHKFNASVAVSLLETKRRCYEGYTAPRVKVIYHREGEKEEEKIVAEYQDIKAEFKKAVEVLLRVKQVGKRKRVKRIRLVIGGDHGQGAFRLGFRVLIDTESDEGEKEVLHKTINIATVHCKKEVGAILESTVIDWVTEDLKYINENRLHLLNVNRRVVTCFESDLGTMHQEEDNLIDPIVIEQFMAGDLAWESFCLGKEAAASSWCIYCKLSPSAWSAPGHTKGEVWDIDGLQEMADSNAKGAKRLGVKRRPYFPWIPVENYILPVLHLCIGLGNNVIDYFGHLVEWTLTKLSDEERGWKNRVVALDRELIQQKRDAVNEWKASTRGKQRTALMALRRNRAQTVGLLPNETEELAELDAEFTALGKARDELKSERKNLMEKIEKAHESRRKPPKEVTRTWYLLMERIYRDCGVKREDYHKRKFSGRPLKEIMRKSEKIFTEAKQMLREFKDDSIDGIDAKIDNVCDNMISLLSSWGKVFNTLYSKDPSQEDKAQFKIDLDTAVRKHRALRGLVDYNNDTPKLHCIEDHAVDALERFPDLLLMIEEWVEQFHQTEKKRVENRVRFMRDVFKRAESASKKRAAVNDSTLMVQSRRTKKPRGGYKPKNV